MTEAELVEHAQMAYGNAIAAFALMFTMLSAYLVAAYLAGKALSFSQMLTVNLFFIVSVVMTIAAEASFLSAALNSSLEAFAINPARAVIPLHSSIAGIVALIDLLIMIGCLKFMWDVRHQDSD